MKNSDLERLAVMDEKTKEIVQGAVRTFSGIDPKVISGAAEAARQFQTLKLGNLDAINDALKGFESIRPIVAPQISLAIAESLKGVVVPPAPSIAAAFAGGDPPKFAFAKNLDDAKLASMFKPVVSDAMKSWAMPPAFTRSVSEALGGITAGVGTSIAPLTAVAVSSAVAVSHAPAVVEAASESLSEVDLDALSPSERIELQAKVIGAIATLGTVVALLLKDGRIELAGAMLGFVAILVSIYADVSK